MIDNMEYIDAESALGRIGGNVSLYKRLLNHFLNDNHIDDLCNAIESNNIDEILRLAHTIKGVSANLSLPNLRAVSTNIETNAKNGLDCTALIPEIRRSYEDTEQIITDYTNQP